MPVGKYETPNYEVQVVRDHNICEPGTIRTQDIGKPGGSYRRTCIDRRIKSRVTLSFWIWKGEPPKVKKMFKRRAEEARKRVRRR